MVELANRSHKFEDYIRALEGEKKKIQMFQRELPLCLQLVSQAIDSLRQTESSVDDESISEAAPILAEFLPLKPSLSSTFAAGEAPANRTDQKPDWLRSVQLWNQESDSDPKLEPPTKPIAVKTTGGAFQPFQREKHAAANPSLPAAGSPASETPVAVATASSSTASTGGGGDVDYKLKECKTTNEKDDQSQSQAFGSGNKKARRCWSPELHRRFIQALQQLGGAHVATPKQIRELMKVDGLTNDEVKSHLQKYRLHTRRPSPATQSNNNVIATAPQFVVVGGIYAVAAAQQTNPPSVHNEIYAPVAIHPPVNVRSQHINDEKNNKRPRRLPPTGPLASDGRCSEDNNSLRDDEDDTHNSVSPSSSLSSQTTAWPQI